MSPLVDDWAAGVVQIQNTCGFVEGFAGRIVDGPADQFQIGWRTAIVDMCVSPAHNQANARVDIFVSNHLAGVQMSLNVVDSYHRNIKRPRDGLGCRQPNQQRAHQSWLRRDRNQIDVVRCRAGVFECLVDDRKNAFDMRAGSDFGDDSAEVLVEFGLSGHDTGTNLPRSVDDRGGSLVT